MNGDQDVRVQIKQPPSIKERLSLQLTDKLNPEMITFFFDSEIELITRFETAISLENEKRLKLGLSLSVWTNELKMLKVHRTSRKGWRGTQLENVIKSNIDSEEKNSMGLGNLFNKSRGV